MHQPRSVKRRRAGRWEWVQGESLHREGLPAIEWDDGSREWYRKGRLHRIDGPAVYYPMANPGQELYKEWWIENKRLDVQTQEEFERYLKMKAFW